MKEAAPSANATDGQTTPQTGEKPLWSRPAFDTLTMKNTMNSSTVVADSTSDQHS